MQSPIEWARLKLAGGTNLFKDVPFDQKKFDHAMSWTPATNRYVVFFTPRSGSSRLTDLATRTKALGSPGECYNPAFVPNIASAYSARNREEYTQLLLRRRQTDGVFGCEVTHTHMIVTHKTGQAFLDAVQPTSTLWLLREDIVAQAVSVSRMKQTKVSHSVSADDGAIARAEDVFTYSPRVIASVIKRIRVMEEGTEELIREAGLDPLRISYEQTISMRPRRLMAIMGLHVGVPPKRMQLDDLESGHKKVSGSKSNDFAARFRQENAAFMAEIDAARAPMLAEHAKGLERAEQKIVTARETAKAAAEQAPGETS